MGKKENTGMMCGENMTEKMFEYVEKRDKMMGKLHTIYNYVAKVVGCDSELCRIIGDFKSKISMIDLRKSSYDSGLKLLELLEKEIQEEIPEYWNQDWKYMR